MALSLAAQKTETVARSVFFETDSHVLDSFSEKTLTDLAAELRASPDFEIEIEAFADDRGSKNHNQILAEKRAASVSDFLVKKEVRARSISLKSRGEIGDEKGETESLESLKNARRQNRRVDIRAKVSFFSDLAAKIEAAALARIFARRRHRIHIRRPATPDRLLFPSKRSRNSRFGGGTGFYVFLGLDKAELLSKSIRSSGAFEH